MGSTLCHALMMAQFLFKNPKLVKECQHFLRVILMPTEYDIHGDSSWQTAYLEL
jgi:hypothetical protein